MLSNVRLYVCAQTTMAQKFICAFCAFCGDLSLIAFDVYDLTQNVIDVDQLSTVLHHFVNVFVSLRDLIDERLRVTERYVAHRLFQIFHREPAFCFAPRKATARSMRC